MHQKDKSSPFAWLVGWMFVILLVIWPPNIWMRLQINRRKHQLTHDLPQAPLRY